MKLSQLLYGADVEIAFADVEITCVTDKFENCTEGCAFVCIEGEKYDGHDFAAAAAKKGAAVLITQKDTGHENQIIVRNTRRVYALMCSNYFGRPSEKMKVIAVTGTNGKTTTANIIYSLLTLFGHKAGLIGTVENIVCGEAKESTYTTPGAFEFNCLLNKMVSHGAEYCVCEVSSQALSQCRTDGCRFFCGVFTNITHEHLDYHKTFENYLAAKKKLFTMCENAVINLDDPYSDSVLSGIGCPAVTFSVGNDEADITARSVCFSGMNVNYAAVTYSDIARVSFRGIGEYSVRNSLAALSVMRLLGFPFEEICDKMKLIKPVRGRGEIIETNRPFTVLIDYAHTPDALYNVLYALRKQKTGRLIVLFGCGGDRDKTKRAKMGQIASLLADVAIITDDNPRSENEEAIINDILIGVKDGECEVFTEKDRARAIKLALEMAKEGDIVLLAGKGHEAYQIINNKKMPFDEREKVAQLLR